VDPDRRLLIPLEDAQRCREASIGGKAAKLARLRAAGFPVPEGFCLTVSAYDAFVREHRIDEAIRMELGRKPLDGMRWEEMWDSALRIRSRFLAQPLPPELEAEIRTALHALAPTKPLVVRSSAPGEDSAGRSFAGLHESYPDVSGEAALHDAVRLVWASLWSDAALLYRRELRLDPATSRMAVLVQETASGDRSGVAFGRDPRPNAPDRALIEAVPGPCRLLVDGEVDPDRWEIDRGTRRVVGWRPGQRAESEPARPLLDPSDLDAVTTALFGLETLFAWPPDMEWTGRAGSLTILQARPITTGTAEDERSWYLTLRPGDDRLRRLRTRVAEELIPELETEGRALAAANLSALDDRALGDTIEARHASLERWKQIYWDEFIPFAHGARRLGMYYNDAVRPTDPYEFVGLLRNQKMLASQRNQALAGLAARLHEDEALRAALARLLDAGKIPPWPALRRALDPVAGAGDWLDAFEQLAEQHLDIVVREQPLEEGFEPHLRTVLELAESGASGREEPNTGERPETLQARLLDAVGQERRAEAMELIETGRLSWRLRDDDNLLVARIETQLVRALHEGGDRLRGAGRLTGPRAPGLEEAAEIARALRDPRVQVAVPNGSGTAERGAGDRSAPGERPRQLIGQPASPGLATGRVRVVRGRADLGKFRHREVLVCDAIQPSITHLVPLASAIVERRGGMLIHGAIIARELGIPCVNGVRDAADVLHDGEAVTVDGNLGIVTVGPPEFDLELAPGA
jgi:pyruvate,water dikinase